MVSVCSNVMVARSGRDSSDSICIRAMVRLNETMAEQFEHGEDGKFSCSERSWRLAIDVEYISSVSPATRLEFAMERVFNNSRLHMVFNNASRVFLCTRPIKLTDVPSSMPGRTHPWAHDNNNNHPQQRKSSSHEPPR